MSPRDLGFKKKPIIVCCSEQRFIVADCDRHLYESLPGKRWAGHERLHFCADEFFFIDDADGTCRACRVGGRCISVKVRVLHVPDRRQLVRPDRLVERIEIKKLRNQLPRALWRELVTFREAHELTKEEEAELNRIHDAARRPWRIFRRPVPWRNPDGKKIELGQTESWRRVGETQDESEKVAAELRQWLARAKQRRQ